MYMNVSSYIFNVSDTFVLSASIGHEGCTEQSLEMQRARCAWVSNSVFRADNAVVRQEILSFVSGPSRGPAGFLRLGAWESASPWKALQSQENFGTPSRP